MQTLKGMQQRRAVVLGEYVCPDLDSVVGANGHDHAVEGGVVDLAHRDAVRDYRLSALRVWTNVGCVQQFVVPQATQGTPMVIGARTRARNRG